MSCRADLRRLIVVQGDTEPASVEQQRHLCQTAPSLYDLRNLFQVNVEEGRHLWAMVYLLHAYFGRDGRDEADLLLARHSGDADNPRILGAFNEPTTDWLSFFMFTYFTDRDGKFQLASLAESGFDPLARTCQFMLKEEAHHMFVGAGGVGRVVQRTTDLMLEHDTEDVAPYGGINLDTLQRYLNLTSASRSTCSAPRRPPTPPTTSPPVSKVASRRRPGLATTACMVRRRWSPNCRRVASWRDPLPPWRRSTPPSGTTTSPIARRASTGGTAPWHQPDPGSGFPTWGSTGRSAPSPGNASHPTAPWLTRGDGRSDERSAADRCGPGPRGVGDEPRLASRVAWPGGWRRRPAGFTPGLSSLSTCDSER